MRAKNLLLTVVMAYLSMAGVQAKTIYYVKVNGTGNGTSWSNAAGNIQDMINKAVAGDEVWVAAGTYYPTAQTTKYSDPNDKTFLMKNGVSLYGGFAGNETTIDNRAKSDKDGSGKVEAWEFTNETILSGIVSDTQKSTCVVEIGNTYSTTFTIDTQFDGFTVSNGCMGIYGYGTITINNCIISDNNKTDGSNTGYWGGIKIGKGTMSNCKVTNNLAYLIADRFVGNYSASGGGIYNDGGTISNCVIANNSCQIYTHTQNSATAMGGGIYNNGGLVNKCIVINNSCTASRDMNTTNASAYGGGIYNNGGIVSNCCVTNNVSSGDTGHYGDGIYNSGNSSNSAYAYCSTVINNSGYNISSNDNGFTYNCINVSNNLNQDFFDPLPYSSSYTDIQILQADWQLKTGSEFIDAGSLDSLPDWVINGTDLAGNPRTHDGKISTGAYEYDPSYTGKQLGNITQTWNIGYPNETDVVATLAEGTLVISGTGNTKDFGYINGTNTYAPWRQINQIKNVIIKDGVTSIGNWLLADLSNLESVTIPNSVISIGESALCENDALNSITIPNSVKSIGDYAFIFSGLTSINIPNGVIGGYTFEDCFSLTSVTIGSGVTSIGDYAFAECFSLTNVEVLNPNPATIFMGDGVFESVDLNNCTLRVPTGAVELYKNAPVWKDFFNIVGGTETAIPDVSNLTVSISPSPSADFINISGLQSNEPLCIYNINGQLLITRKATGNTETVPVGHLPSGVYLLKTGNGQTVKWVKR